MQHHLHTKKYSTAGSYFISFAAAEEGRETCYKTGPDNLYYELFIPENSHLESQGFLYWKTVNNRAN